MGIALVPRGIRALSDQINAYYRVFKGTDPDSVYIRLNSGGSFEVRHSATNAPVLHVDDSGANLTIGPEDIADGSVLNSKLAPNSVTTDKIADGTIVDADISPTANIGGGKIAAGTIGSAQIGDGSLVDADISPTANIAGSKLLDNSVNGTKIITGSIGSAQITDGTIVNADISPTAAIDAATRLADASVTLAKLAPNSVDSSKLVDGSIANLDVAAAAAIAITKLADLGANNVLRSNGAGNVAGKIVTGDMVANTINGDRLLDSSVPAAKILGGAPPPNGSGAADAWKAYATGAAGTTVSLQQIVDAMISATAAIALSKLSPGAAGVVKSNGSAISAGNQIQYGDMAGNSIATGHIQVGAVNHVALEFKTTADSGTVGISAGAWTNIFASQLYSINDPNSIIEAFVRGAIAFQSPTAGTTVATRIIVQNSTSYGPLGGGIVNTAGQWVNALAGADGLRIANFGTGSFQIQVQLWCSNAGSFHVQAASLPDVESVGLLVMERLR